MIETRFGASWRPLLEGELAERTLQAVEEIAQALAELASTPPQPASSGFLDSQKNFSVSSGRAGVALFFAYLDRARPGRGYDDLAAELLDQAIEGMGRLLAPPGLYSGFPGVAWVLEHLQGRLFDPEEGDPGEEIAALLEDRLGQSPWSSTYDLIGGLVGLGVYALERRPRPGGDECLRRVVERLAEAAERHPDGITWKTPYRLLPPEARERYPHGNYNVGVAHGVPGAVALLAEACAAGVEARSLLDGAVAWLLAQKLPPGSYSVFPAAVPAGDGAEPRETKLAWCYGDAGIAAALLGAGRRAGEPAWEREALELARGAARRPGKMSGVHDASVCHGSAGLAHLFNRMFQATGEPLLGDEARWWLEQTLAFRRPGQGIGGFLSWDVDEAGNRGSAADRGFLTGAAGVGLALLAAATPVEPAWDRLLLVSVPPSSAP